MATNNYANSEQLIDILQAQQIPVLGAGGGFAPIGTINFFDASVAPEGWLACDGTVYNISTYPDLATYYASVHGSSNFYGGNGTTTFAVPDLQGEFLRGSGTNSHTNQGSGANVGVHQDGTITFMSESGYGIYAPDGNNVPTTNKDSVIPYGNLRRYTATGTESGACNFYTSRPTNTSFLICVKATVSGNPEGHVYSTEEQIVGTWVDGSNVYEKTIDVSSQNIRVVNGRWVEVADISSLNVNTIIDAETVGVNGLMFGLYDQNAQHKLRMWVTGYDDWRILYVTIRYTKTS